MGQKNFINWVACAVGIKEVLEHSRWEHCSLKTGGSKASGVLKYN